MNIVDCPRCHKASRVPISASENATVQCPHCDEEYALSQTGIELPPELIILSDPSPVLKAADSQGAESQVEASEVTRVELVVDHEDEPEYGLVGEPMNATVGAETESKGTLPAFDFAEASAPQSDRGPNYQIVTPGGESESGSSRSKRSGIGQVIGVICGGALALPLAQICLWWIFAEDPVELGPSISQYVPIVVPQQFRGGAGELEGGGEQDGDSSDLNSDRGTNDSGGRDWFGGNEDENANTDLLERHLDDDSSVSSTSMTEDNDSTDSEREDGEPSLFSKQSLNGDKREDESANSEPTVFSFDFETSEIDLRKLHQTDADTIRQSVEKAVQAKLAWQQALSEEDVASIEATSLGYYAAVSEIGHSILFSELEDEETLRAIGAADLFLQNELSQDTVNSLLADETLKWLQDVSRRSNEGLFVFGTLSRLRKIDHFYDAEILLSEGLGERVHVYGWMKPPKIFRVGKRVMVLGGYVADPKKNIGLETDESEVICGGFVRVLQATTE